MLDRRPFLTAAPALVAVVGLLVGAATVPASAAPPAGPGDGGPGAVAAADGAADRSAGGPTHRKKRKKRPTLRELRAEAERLAAEMEARTAALESLEVQRDEAQAQLERIRAEAVEARATAVHAHDQLGRFASAAYRGQQVPLEITVLVSPQGDTSDTLHTLVTLTHTGEIKTDIATFAAQAAERADALEEAARQAADTAAATAYRVAMQVNDLIVLARENRKSLKHEVARLERVAARKLAAECRDRAAVAERYPNGLIPAEVLCEVEIGGFRLRGDAAVAFKELAAAYERDHETQICLTDAYRTLAGQVAVFEQKPELAAVPGTSKHGRGLAVDLCGGIERSGTPEHEWMQENAVDFGWVHPAWARVDGTRPEAWHWEYVPEIYELRTQEREEREAARSRDGTTRTSRR